MESTPGEDAVRMAEMTARILGYHMNSVNKAAAGLRGWTTFERSSIAGKTLSSGILCYREIVHERKTQGMQPTSLLHFTKLEQPSQPSAGATRIGWQPSTLRKDPPPATRLQLAEGSDDH